MSHTLERRPASRRIGGDTGQAVTMVLVVTAVIALVLSTGFATLGRTAVDRQRARTAADAAALAGVTGGRARAADLAARHGAELVGWDAGADEVVVVVRLGDARATARATDAP